MNKVMYAGQNNMLVEDSVNRINGILELKPLPEPEIAETQKDNSIVLKNVSFSYTGAQHNAVDGVSLSVAPGGAHCPRRSERRRKDHHRQPDLALLGCTGGTDTGRRRGRQKHFQGQADGYDIIRVSRQQDGFDLSYFFPFLLALPLLCR